MDAKWCVLSHSGVDIGNADRTTGHTRLDAMESDELHGGRDSASECGECNWWNTDWGGWALGAKCWSMLVLDKHVRRLHTCCFDLVGK